MTTMGTLLGVNPDAPYVGKPNARRWLIYFSVVITAITTAHWIIHTVIMFEGIVVHGNDPGGALAYFAMYNNPLLVTKDLLLSISGLVAEVMLVSAAPRFSVGTRT